MKNKCYIVFQVLKVYTPYIIIICKIQPVDLLFLVVFISFYISADIIFYKFLELHSTLGYSRKKKKTGRRGVEDILFWKPPGFFRFFNLLEIPEKTSLHPCPRNSTKLCYTPQKLWGLKPRPLEIPHDFSWSPWKFHLNIIWKKGFCHKFSFFKFLTDSLKPPTPASIMDKICEAW